jgi:hypothetical protein
VSYKTWILDHGPVTRHSHVFVTTHRGTSQLTGQFMSQYRLIVRVARAYYDIISQALYTIRILVCAREYVVCQTVAGIERVVVVSLFRGGPIQERPYPY